MSAVDELVEAVEGAGLVDSTRILVAVSGGPDSVALLLALVAANRTYGHRWEFRIGHINHALRGSESNEDEAFVRDLAHELGVDVDVRGVDTPAYALSMKLSIETAARELRRAALAEMLEEWGGELIATGHTLNDQVETVLLRLLRGTGPEGLGGIRPRDGLWVRPLLEVRRQTVVGALEQLGQPYRLDSSNLDRYHRRNRVRHEVLPALEALQPQVVQSLGRVATLARIEAGYLTQEAERALLSLEVEAGVDVVSAGLGAWRAMHPALRRQTLRHLLRRLLGDARDIDEAHLALLDSTLVDSSPGSRLVDRLPRGIHVGVHTDRFTLRLNVSPAPRLPDSVLPIPSRLELPAGTLTAGLVDTQACATLRQRIAVAGPFHALYNVDAVGSSLSVRARRPGDRIHPLGAPGRRKLQDVMVDRRVPASVRDVLPVVETRDGRILWVPGVVLSEEARVDEGAERAVHLSYRPQDMSNS